MRRTEALAQPEESVLFFPASQEKEAMQSRVHIGQREVDLVTAMVVGSDQDGRAAEDGHHVG